MVLYYFVEYLSNARDSQESRHVAATLSDTPGLPALLSKIHDYSFVNTNAVTVVEVSTRHEPVLHSKFNPRSRDVDSYAE